MFPNTDRSTYSMEKYKFALESPYKFSDVCCKIMKKTPAHNFYKQTGRKPMIATMASESRLRTQKWIQNGCNGFKMKIPTSTPMSFWTEQDVLEYIREYIEDPLAFSLRMLKLSPGNSRYRKRHRKYVQKNYHGTKTGIASVYGEIVYDHDDDDNLDEQMTLADLDPTQFGVFDMERPLLKTTGLSRTGCMFCGFGCHMKGDTRFVQMKETHPKIYDYLMRPESEGGLNYKEIIDWINENGNMNIKY